MVFAYMSVIASSETSPGLEPQLTEFPCGSEPAREEASTANTTIRNDKGHPKVAFVSRAAS
jgi:hypothetical protein